MMAFLFLDIPLLSNSEFLLTIIVVSSIIAVAYKRLTGATPGGIVSIGVSIVLLLKSPLWGISCFLLSFPAFWAYRLSISRVDRNGRFPYVYALALVSVISGLIIAPYLKPLLASDVAGVAVGGLVLPAILANQYRLNGYSSVIRGYCICVALGIIFVLCTLTVADSFGLSDALFPNIQVDNVPEYERYLRFYPLASIASLLLGFYVYSKCGIRSGGYVMAPFAAQILGAPITSWILLSGLLLLYLFQACLTRHTFIVGLQRYLANIILASVYVALSITVLQRFFGVDDGRYFGSAWIVALVLAAYSTDLYVYRRGGSYIFIALNTFIASFVLLLERGLLGSHG